MAHEITYANGKHEMAYVGEKPWHGLGQELQAGASIEEWKVAAGMDWKAQRATVRYATERQDSGMQVWPEQHVLFRSDTKAPLGLVSDGFQVVQPGAVLEFFRDLTAAAGFKLITAGTLKGGRKFWAQADIGEAAAIVGKDIVKGRILLATAVDGTMNTIAKNISERVVCANTLAIGLGESGSMVRVSHRSKFDADQVKAQLGIAVPQFLKFIAEAREMAAYKLAVPHGFVDQLLGEKDETEKSAGWDKIMSLFTGEGRGASMPGAKGTLWGMVNAVTEYADHHVRARSVDNRIDSAWFGMGDRLKSSAYKQALELVNA
jgi:phage/plasmid-like protein (TIGR03299 family)